MQWFIKMIDNTIIHQIVKVEPSDSSGIPIVDGRIVKQAAEYAFDVYLKEYETAIDKWHIGPDWLGTWNKGYGVGNDNSIVIRQSEFYNDYLEVPISTMIHEASHDRCRLGLESPFDHGPGTNTDMGRLLTSVERVFSWMRSHSIKGGNMSIVDYIVSKCKPPNGAPTK